MTETQAEEAGREEPVYEPLNRHDLMKLCEGNETIGGTALRLLNDARATILVEREAWRIARMKASHQFGRANALEARIRDLEGRNTAALTKLREIAEGSAWENPQQAAQRFLDELR